MAMVNDFRLSGFISTEITEKERYANFALSVAQKAKDGRFESFLVSCFAVGENALADCKKLAKGDKVIVNGVISYNAQSEKHKICFKCFTINKLFDEKVHGKKQEELEPLKPTSKEVESEDDDLPF